MTENTTAGFVWHDLMTTDPERAVAFYGGLFGWTTRVDELGPYAVLVGGERDLGGIVPLGPGDGTRSHWLSYCAVADLAAALRRAAEIGGAVLRPVTPIPGIGEFAIVADPEGAALAPFTYAAGATAADATPAPGAFGWHELLTRDLEQARRFYDEVYGLAASALEIPGLGPYWVFSGGGAPVAGALPMPPEATAPAQWLAYVLVEDVDATAARARALGAKPHAAPADVPGVGRYAVLDDPTGAMFAVFRTAAR